MKTSGHEIADAAGGKAFRQAIYDPAVAGDIIVNGQMVQNLLSTVNKKCYIFLPAMRTSQGVCAMSVRSTIIAQFERVAQEQNKNSPRLSDNLILLESGLDSLCFAIIVARLEDALGLDPFSTSDDMDFPVTLGDFIRLYENAAK